MKQLGNNLTAIWPNHTLLVMDSSMLGLTMLLNFIMYSMHQKFYNKQIKLITRYCFHEKHDRKNIALIILVQLLSQDQFVFWNQLLFVQISLLFPNVLEVFTYNVN